MSENNTPLTLFNLKNISTELSETAGGTGINSMSKFLGLSQESGIKGGAMESVRKKVFRHDYLMIV